MNRRTFLKFGSQAIASAYVMGQFGFLKRALAAGTDPSKFLFYIRGGGGGYYHTNLCPYHPGWTGTSLPVSIASGSDVGLPFKNSGRIDDRVGSTLGASYGWTSSDFNNFTVIKGIPKAGEHGANYRPFQAGSSSPYAQDFSIRAAVTVAAQQAPLSYCALGYNFSNKGTETSPAANSILFTSQDAWAAMSNSQSAGDLPAFAQDLKNASLQKLARSPASLLNPLRSTIHETFANSLSAATQLRSQHYATEARYLANAKKYMLAMLNAHKALLNDTSLNGIMNNYKTWYSRDYKPRIIDSEIATVQSQTTLQTWPGMDSISADCITMAYRFALAEQMARLGLSRVLDIVVPGTDAHHGDQMVDELFYSTSILVAIREFMKDLKTTIVPGTTKTIFERSAGIFMNEFDRSPEMSDPFGGTKHGVAIHALLFGGLFNTSKIFGAVGMGMNAPSYSGMNTYTQYPVKVNLTNGQPDPNGVILETSYIFPTVCAAMGASIPLQQITDYHAITALVNSAA